MENMYYVQSENSQVNQRKRAPTSKTNRASSYGQRHRGAGLAAARRYEKGVSVGVGGTGVART